MLQFNQLTDIKRRVCSKLAPISGNVRNNYAVLGPIASAGPDIELRRATKLPSGSPIDVSHQSFLRQQVTSVAELSV